MRSLSYLSSPFFKLLEILLFYVNGYSGWLFVIWEDGTLLRKCWPDYLLASLWGNFMWMGASPPPRREGVGLLGTGVTNIWSCEMLTPT